MNMTSFNRTGNPMNDSTITSLFSLIVAIFAVGGVFGGLAAGWWAVEGNGGFARRISFHLFP